MTNSGTEPAPGDLRIFLCVVERRGFRAAAKHLGLSPAKVSETVSRLERALGVPLLFRTTRSISPTDAGRALADRVAPLLAEMDAALIDAANSRQVVRGTLRLDVPGAVVRDILPPLVEAYLARHPEVRVEIAVDDRLVDVTALGFDAGIRYGEHLALDTIAIPIGPRVQQLALAASPGYLAARGAPRHPTELLEHDCIRLKFSNGGLVRWELAKEGETLTVNPAARITVGVAAVDAALAFARSGFGVVATFRNWLEADFVRGTLVPVLPDWWMSFEGPKLYCSSRFMTPPLRAFVDLIRSQAET